MSLKSIFSRHRKIKEDNKSEGIKKDASIPKEFSSKEMTDDERKQKKNSKRKKFAIRVAEVALLSIATITAGFATNYSIKYYKSYTASVNYAALISSFKENGVVITADADSLKYIISNTPYVLVQFSTPSCLYCRTSMPRLLESKKRNTNVFFVYFNLGDCPDVNRLVELNIIANQILHIPKFSFFVNGKEIKTYVGEAIQISDSENSIDQLIKPTINPSKINKK